MRHYKRRTVEALGAHRLTAQQLVEGLPKGRRTGKFRTEYTLNGQTWHSLVELVTLPGMQHGGPVYVKCPHCQQRARYLFALERGLRCRTCYGLTNVSTQTAPGGSQTALMQSRRVERLQAQLKACTDALDRTRPMSQRRRRLYARQGELIDRLEMALDQLLQECQVDTGGKGSQYVQGIIAVVSARAALIDLEAAAIVRRRCKPAA